MENTKVKWAWLRLLRSGVLHAFLLGLGGVGGKFAFWIGDEFHDSQAC